MKTVLVTGGTRGIGAAMVRTFSAAGYSVAFTYINSEEAADKLGKECGALAIKADSSVEDDVIFAVEKVKNTIGCVDILINNAAISSFSLFTDITLDEWEKIFKVNVTGAFLYSKAVLPEMINKKQGRIINISSMWGITGSSCEVHYSASKAALIGMTKALAKEVGPSGITVNCITPGVIDTDMNRTLSKDDIKALCNETPLMRIGLPSEVADAALFLAGDSAAFITGEVMNINGGFLI